MFHYYSYGFQPWLTTGLSNLMRVTIDINMQINVIYYYYYYFFLLVEYYHQLLLSVARRRSYDMKVSSVLGFLQTYFVTSKGYKMQMYNVSSS